VHKKSDIMLVFIICFGKIEILLIYAVLWLLKLQNFNNNFS